MTYQTLQTHQAKTFEVRLEKHDGLYITEAHVRMRDGTVIDRPARSDVSRSLADAEQTFRDMVWCMANNGGPLA